MLLLVLILPFVACDNSWNDFGPPSTEFEIRSSEEVLVPPSRSKRGDSVSDGGSATIVSYSDLMKDTDPALPKPVNYNQINKRAVDLLAESDKKTTLDGARKKRLSETVMALPSPSLVSFENMKKRSVGQEEAIAIYPEFDSGLKYSNYDFDYYRFEGSGDSPTISRAVRQTEHVMALGGATLVDSFDNLKKRSAEPEDAVSTVEEVKKHSADSAIDYDDKRIKEQGAESTAYSPDPETERKKAEMDYVDDTQEDSGEGSGDDKFEEKLREVRQAESETILGDEQQVDQTASAQIRPDENENESDRHRPSSPRPPILTCATVDCRRGMQCVMENGRPACKPMEPEPQPERSCRDINCPRESRCRMERDPRCRSRDCSEQPVCVREARPSCRNVLCPSGSRCTVMEEPGCRGWNCREMATCVNPCDGVRCPFGTSCRFDGRDAICVSISFNPCLSARCPGGFECRSVQNQAQCFPISTPAPTLPPTTPSPSTCPGQNEEFASCATFCEPTCVDKNPACVLACAAPRCQCANGFYRNQQGVCVFSEQCEFIPSCGPNETFNQCSTPCEPQCGQPVALACPAICGPSKCQCKQGFWRHSTGSCVQNNQCFNG
ncbi:hypothetical protein PENTCL1PPCAC_17303 [Pristionchus entomophagus]|uniref:Follistatin-like domain-containing protein n=1 Tax=Pristionchus entomophagus TaxID=358040 RepID=A0AAV5TL48_9BILA|nr:hypothetical protein PENTCL1PPCAC_17303 [Pristionchus entomophagus]